jgi:hypothetical protein
VLVPDTQMPVAEHALPHAPQLSGSEAVLTQLLPQTVDVESQAPTHLPASQSGVVPEHTFPQAPQLLGSLAVGVQTPAHFS